MLWLFLAGYVMGLVFYYLSYELLLRSAARKQERPSIWTLRLSRWVLMPAFLLGGSFLYFGRFDSHAFVLLGGYIVSRTFRVIRVLRGTSPSDQEVLDAMFKATYMRPDQSRDVSDYLRKFWK